MSTDHAFNFAKVGRNLERADMTTRIVDVGCLNLMNPEQQELAEYENILWMNVLRSLTAYQMYRQHVQDIVNGEDVVDFLLMNAKFPRAVVHCLNEVESCSLTLPRSDEVTRAINHTQRLVSGAKVAELLENTRLHEFIDGVQLDLNAIHDRVSATWFGGAPDPQPARLEQEHAP
ncbi:MAG: alpha-E domain-containing protein [Gammaproteobacteria bacterium]|nr:alpha-E domain-containing protein [Gammaproteobacteria bacterium]